MNVRLLSVVLVLSCSASLFAGDGRIHRRPFPKGNSYNVILNKSLTDAVDVIADDLVKAHGVGVVATWKHALAGFNLQMTEEQALRVARDSRVAFVEEDHRVFPQAATSFWQLDRIDNRVSPRLDGFYSYCTAGKGVRAYVVDDGVWAGHDEFSNPDPITGGPRVLPGWDWENARYGTPNQSTSPCGLQTADLGGSHGTAVASVLGGKTMGSASSVRIVAVRVFNCVDTGWSGDVISGLNWIPTDPGRTTEPRIVNFSSAYPVSNCQQPNTAPCDITGIETAFQGLLNQGITVTVAAGNYNAPIAQDYSPARMDGVITVGGSKNSDPDGRWDYQTSAVDFGSNYGPRIDVFAPATGITCAYWSSSTAVRTTGIDGTSFAAPLVAGIAARLLEIYPYWTGADVRTQIITMATTDVHGLNLANRIDSPNRLLWKGTERCVRP